MVRYSKYSIALLFVLLANCVFGQKNVVVSNLRPQMDLDGEIVDAHDGCMLQSGTTFYWYGVAYGERSPLSFNNSIRCYSSKDWRIWKDENLQFPDQPKGIVGNPKVVFNKKNKQFVLWFIWKGKDGITHYGVAKSTNPIGPFSLVNDKINLFNLPDGLGDFNLFVDTNETAYIAYSTERDRGVSVEKLNADYVSSTLQNGGYLNVSGYDVGAMFCRNGKYYLLMDKTLALDSRGTGAKVFVSNRPMDSYVFRRNINRYPGTYAPVLLDKMLEPNQYSTLLKKVDATFPEVEIETMDSVSMDCIKVVLYTGNRTKGGVNVDVNRLYEPIETPYLELQQWRNGGWVTVSASQKAMTSSVYTIVTLRFALLKNRHVRLRFASKYNGSIYVNELEVSNSNKVYNGLYKVFVCDLSEERCPPIIPGLTSCVFPLTENGVTRYIWMADLLGSSSDNKSGHDYTYFSKPLEFSGFGDIEPMIWADGWLLSNP